MNKEYKNRLIIFGGAGFLGQHLTKAILDSLPEAAVLILDLKPPSHQLLSFANDERVEYRFGRDITRPETYKDDFQDDIDAVFNLAGFISFWPPERRKMFQINVEGARFLCETSLKAGIKKVIHISSVASIGYIDDINQLADESMVFDEKKFKNKSYMLTKHLGEREALDFSGKGMDVVAANPGLLYGPGENGSVLTLFRNISTGRLKFYPTGGTGVVDVRDAAAGILTVFVRGKAGERYILNGYNISFREMTAIISRTLGREPLRKPVPRISRIPLGILLALTERFRKSAPDLTSESFDFCFRYRYYSPAKAEKELSWRPLIPFEKTIADSAEWYKRSGLL